ncbi:MAG TPA: hypothetical protein VMK13_10705, partial [Streptosporangiaceae bacterium]|nr:hypothetical protein [Streptosporangiaceae bacterium]
KHLGGRDIPGHDGAEQAFSHRKILGLPGTLTAHPSALRGLTGARRSSPGNTCMNHRNSYLSIGLDGRAFSVGCW